MRVSISILVRKEPFPCCGVSGQTKLSRTMATILNSVHLDCSWENSTFSYFGSSNFFSDFFSIMKFCGETVLCNQCAIHLLTENVFGLRILGV